MILNRFSAFYFSIESFCWIIKLNLSRLSFSRSFAQSSQQEKEILRWDRILMGKKREIIKSMGKWCRCKSAEEDARYLCQSLPWPSLQSLPFLLRKSFFFFFSFLFLLKFLMKLNLCHNLCEKVFLSLLLWQEKGKYAERRGGKSQV